MLNNKPELFILFTDGPTPFSTENPRAMKTATKTEFFEFTAKAHSEPIPNTPKNVRNIIVK
ncbi:hypothetical protein HK103_005621 [Boothiomyces macroporosus]|uniref:Uncharacterized protein n=1 Tax=Boothiomyces macroporosus TaxID=261099 RepID=A0AAD5UJ87_9FUNG|nr:hypothetical protein HK103_005621 [Boothiomyces macroporosus]